jgi:hypothetical protein
MKLYQKAIEYYSAKNDDHMAVYLGRLHLLLDDGDVKEILAQGEQS